MFSHFEKEHVFWKFAWKESKVQFPIHGADCVTWYTPTLLVFRMTHLEGRSPLSSCPQECLKHGVYVTENNDVKHCVVMSGFEKEEGKDQRSPSRALL